MSVRFNIRPDVRDLLAANGCDTFEALLCPSFGESLDKPGLEPWRRRYRVVLKDAQDKSRTFYLKCYEDPPARGRWRAIFVGGEWKVGPAAREVAGIDDLQEAGIPAVRWAAWGQDLDNGKERRSFVLTDAVAGDSLERWLPGTFAGLQRDRQAQLKPLVLKEIAALARSFHAAGFVHRDFYLSHIFVDVKSEDTIRLTLIDLQRVFRPVRLQERWRIKDLAQLHYSTPEWFASPDDRLAWMRTYLGAKDLSAPQQDFMNRVSRKAQRIARHDRRRRERQAS